MPARSWWYDESNDASRRPGWRSRGRHSWSTAFAVIAFLAAVVFFSYMKPKHTCSQTMERRADGVVLISTQCRETHSFP